MRAGNLASPRGGASQLRDSAGLAPASPDFPSGWKDPAAIQLYSGRCALRRAASTGVAGRSALRFLLSHPVDDVFTPLVAEAAQRVAQAAQVPNRLAELLDMAFGVEVRGRVVPLSRGRRDDHAGSRAELPQLPLRHLPDAGSAMALAGSPKSVTW